MDKSKTIGNVLIIAGLLFVGGFMAFIVYQNAALRTENAILKQQLQDTINVRIIPEKK